MDDNLLRYNKNVKYCYLDFETQNLFLNFEFNKPWQIGIVNSVGNRITATHNIIVKWPEPLVFEDELVLHTFKTSQEELAYRIETKGIPPERAFRTMKENLEAADVIVVWNGLGFDQYLIKEAYACIGEKCPAEIYDKIIDGNFLIRGIKMGIPYKRGDNLLEYQYKIMSKHARGVKSKLSVVAKEQEIEFDENTLHDAIQDVLLMKKVFEKIVWQVEI